MLLAAVELGASSPEIKDNNDRIPPVITCMYASNFSVDSASQFETPAPTSLHHDAVSKAMVIGGSESSEYQKLKLRAAAQPGMRYEVVLRHAILGAGWVGGKVDVRLLKDDGATVLLNIKTALTTGLDRISGTTGYTGMTQTVLPEPHTGETAPAGTAWIEVEWQLAPVPSNNNRRIALYLAEITELGQDGARPWAVRAPYINHILGYALGSDGTAGSGTPALAAQVDMAHCFSGVVTNFSNDAGIPMVVANGTVLSFMPTSTRPLRPPFTVSAVNEAGRSNIGVEVYLKVDELPPPLKPAAELQDELLVRQYLPPGQAMFPVDCDYLYQGGIPPYIDTLVSAPPFVSMPVGGLIVGRAPTSMVPQATNVTIRRTDLRGDSAMYTLTLELTGVSLEAGGGVESSAATPADGAELEACLKSLATVVLLQPGVAYGFIGSSMYGQALGSASNPTVVYGAAGATLSKLHLNTNGHIVFVNVAFKLEEETDLVFAKKVKGLRFVNCTFLGMTVPVDLNDGNSWVRDDPYRLAGTGIIAREGSHVVIDGCLFENFTEALVTSVYSKSFAVLKTTSKFVADDHCFFQQATSIWLEDVNLLGHSGNHLEGQHRDVVQLANPNQPPVRKILMRRVFGYGDGMSQGCFIRNEDQDHVQSRLPSWEGSHRGLLIDHCVFVGNSAHGLTLLGVRDAEVRNTAVLGHPDETYQNAGVVPAFGQLFLRRFNENVKLHSNIADRILIEDQKEWSSTGGSMSNNFELDAQSLGYNGTRAEMFPAWRESNLPMRSRFRLDSSWLARHPGVGPDMLRDHSGAEGQNDAEDDSNCACDDEHSRQRGARIIIN